MPQQAGTVAKWWPQVMIVARSFRFWVNCLQDGGHGGTICFLLSSESSSDKERRWCIEDNKQSIEQNNKHNPLKIEMKIKTQQAQRATCASLLLANAAAHAHGCFHSATSTKTTALLNEPPTEGQNAIKYCVIFIRSKKEVRMSLINHHESKCVCIFSS